MPEALTAALFSRFKEQLQEKCLNFLSDKLKKEEIYPEEMRLLRGVLQPPFKDRKYTKYFNGLKGTIIRLRIQTLNDGEVVQANHIADEESKHGRNGEAPNA